MRRVPAPASAFRVAALLPVLLAVWTSLVAASIVPDPTWIGGLYDGGDGDEIAIVAGDRLSATPPSDIMLIVLAVPAPLMEPALVPPRAAAVRASGSRAPPAA